MDGRRPPKPGYAENASRILTSAAARRARPSSWKVTYSGSAVASPVSTPTTACLPSRAAARTSWRAIATTAGPVSR